MIVISGALVLVALVLLVIGLIGSSLGLVYASIGASLAAFAFLVAGILQRRKVEPVATAGAPVSADELASVIRTPEQVGTARAEVPAAEETAAAQPAATAGAAAGQVLVVQGRPRYHVAGCRYLAGKLAEEVDVAEARAEGYTACGVCKPDAALAAAEVSAPAEPATEEVEGVSIVEAPLTPARRPAAKAPAKAAKAAPAKAASAAKAAAATAKAAPAKKAATAKPGVVVIPDRDKFHTATCRFVRDAEGAEELSRATAVRKGYSPCGVCKP